MAIGSKLLVVQNKSGGTPAAINQFIDDVNRRVGRLNVECDLIEMPNSILRGYPGEDRKTTLYRTKQVANPNRVVGFGGGPPYLEEQIPYEGWKSTPSYQNPELESEIVLPAPDAEKIKVWPPWSPAKRKEMLN